MTTLQALLATAIGIVPGAVYVAAYDGQVGQGRSSLPDRLTRYITTSAGLHAVLAVASYRIWRVVAFGEAPPLLERYPALALLPGVLYVVLPAVLGVVSAVVARSTGRSLLGNLLAPFRTPGRSRQDRPPRRHGTTSSLLADPAT